MRSVREVEQVASLLAQGLNAVEASRVSGVPWRTIQKWRQAGVEKVIERRRDHGPCEHGRCDRVESVDVGAYAYLLGQYLGDGSIAAFPRQVFRLQIFSDLRYPGIISEVAVAMSSVMPASVVWQGEKTGCAIVSSYSKHWPCLFPQHGPGVKHSRRIELAPWQREIAIAEPRLLLRGLVHSDGCRVINTVKDRPYPRYHFTNRSDDIRGIFLWVCELLGVECRHNNRDTLSIARRASVEQLDTFIGPKR